MNKKSAIIFLIVTGLFLLTSCGKSEGTMGENSGDMEERKDRIEIYDKNQKLILKVEEQKDIDYFSNLLGNTTKNMENEDYPLVKIPKNAKVYREYRFIVQIEEDREIATKFYVYENHPYVTLDGIPVVSHLTWKISEEEHMKLKNPKTVTDKQD